MVWQASPQRGACAIRYVCGVHDSALFLSAVAERFYNVRSAQCLRQGSTTTRPWQARDMLKNPYPVRLFKQNRLEILAKTLAAYSKRETRSVLFWSRIKYRAREPARTARFSPAGNPCGFTRTDRREGFAYVEAAPNEQANGFV
jgi:hypothetical protein